MWLTSDTVAAVDAEALQREALAAVDAAANAAELEDLRVSGERSRTRPDAPGYCTSAPKQPPAGRPCARSATASPVWP